MLSKIKFHGIITLFNRYDLTQQQIKDYTALLSGQIGRLFFSALFFIALTKALSLESLGVFASISAIGLVLSRLSGFGFISPLYRIATTRRSLIGAYTAGYIVAILISLPFIGICATILYFAFYSQHVSLEIFTLILISEILLWRNYEALLIVLNGLEKFTLASILTVTGIAAKAFAALYFNIWGDGTLASWAFIFFIFNGVLTLTGLLLFYPKQALRWAPKAWAGRIHDAFSVSIAEIQFYTQAELDKVLVLIIGGETIAGLYALMMRLIDLTAIPIRAFNTMVIQTIMRKRSTFSLSIKQWMVDTGIAILSTLGLCALFLIIWFFKTHTGENIALAGSFLLYALLVPAFRNLVEYHSELLYAHALMKARIFILSTLSVIKLLCLYALLNLTTDFATIALWLNGLFLMLYGVSAFFTYRSIGRLRC